MHPILARKARLALYLACWIPIGALIVLVLAGGGLAWLTAASLAVPLTVAYAFICLASWYLCRAVPLSADNAVRPVATHMAAAVVSSGLWVLAGRALAREMEQGSTQARIGSEYAERMPLLFVVGILLFLLAIAIHYVTIAVEASRRAEKSALQLKVLASEAELRALKAQVDPHFLFNSLHSISALTSSDPAAARRMCLLLGDFLRLTLKLGGRDVIPLAEELALVEQFLSIERVRFGARLTVERDIDPSVLDCLVPPLLLQPLVENAVTHGIATLTEGGTMRISARRHPVSVTVVVENPCDPDRPAGRGASVGLANVKARLATLYDREANVSVNERDGWFRVELRFPVTTVERPAETPGATGGGTTPGVTGGGITSGATEKGLNRVAQDA